MNEFQKNKTSEARKRATYKYRSKGTRKEVVFAENDADVLSFAEKQCEEHKVSFQRYVINLIREKMDSTGKE